MAEVGDISDHQKDVERLVRDAQRVAASGDHAKAREILARALDHDPDSADLHGRIAFHTYHAGRGGLAEAARLVDHHLGVCREIAPSGPFHPYWSGRIAAAQGNDARARDLWRAALQADPLFAPAQQALAARDQPAQAAAPQATSGRKRPSRRRTIGLGIAAVVLAGIVAADYLMPGVAVRRLADRLGLDHPIVAATQSTPVLMIDVGEAWKEFSVDEQNQRASALADRAADLGCSNVLVYGQGEQLVEIFTGGSCKAPRCIARDVAQVVNGNSRVERTVAPLP